MAAAPPVHCGGNAGETATLWPSCQKRRSRRVSAATHRAELRRRGPRTCSRDGPRTAHARAACRARPRRRGGKDLRPCGDRFVSDVDPLRLQHAEPRRLAAKAVRACSCRAAPAEPPRRRERRRKAGAIATAAAAIPVVVPGFQALFCVSSLYTTSVKLAKLGPRPCPCAGAGSPTAARISSSDLPCPTSSLIFALLASVSVRRF